MTEKQRSSLEWDKRKREMVDREVGLSSICNMHMCLSIIIECVSSSFLFCLEDELGSKERTLYTKKKAGMYGVLHLGMGLELVKISRQIKMGAYVMGRLL